uniref:non-specific serine/threonine protein kinase n=2 Tax=Chrysotila carterae TaxID=13221 RepID=A0A7S4BXW9_CHRCT
MSLEEYVVEKAIGRGHFSTVHRAVRKQDGTRVALKKVAVFDTLDAKARERTLREVKLLQTLPSHASIIQYIDSFIENNELYIVFEWAEHGDLRRLLRKASEEGTPLSESQVWRFFTQICMGVNHMHEYRVMHRDIKPANIFLAANACVKLGDLGLGRAFSSQTYEAMSKVGTPLYMSPEVLDGRGYEWKSDVWSLGCLLYELATLRSPFKSVGDKDNLYTLFKKISTGQFEKLPTDYSKTLCELVRAMLQTDPTARPDMKTVLQVASKALAAHERAETQAAADSAGDGRRDTNADCFIVMEAVLDKLKLLDYEKGLLRQRNLPPLPRGYFTSESLWPAKAQFQYLYKLLCWLLQLTSSKGDHDLWRLLSPDALDADALSCAQTLLDAIGKAGAPIAEHAQLGPHKLRAAAGIEVCKLLNTMTNVALSAAGFAWSQPQRQAEAEIEDEIEGEADAEDDADDADGDHDVLDDCLCEEDLGDGSLAAPPLHMPLLASSVPPLLWREECERVGPLLQLRVPWQSLHWRHRVALVREHAPHAAHAADAAAPALERVGEAAKRDSEQLAPLFAEQRRIAEASRVPSERLAAAQQHLATLEQELLALEAATAKARDAALAKGAMLSDNSAVVEMQAATRKMRLEAKELAMRVGMLQQELMSRRGQQRRQPSPAVSALKIGGLEELSNDSMSQGDDDR